MVVNLSDNGDDDNLRSLMAAMSAVGDRWTLPVVFVIGRGDARFEQIQSRLSIARNILSRRLETLVDAGVLVRVPYNDRPLRHEYLLTPRGRLKFDLAVDLIDWSARWSQSDRPQ